MLFGVAVGVHDYTGPGASAITIGIIAIVVVILVGAYARGKR